jgi:hypothetical protein
LPDYYIEVEYELVEKDRNLFEKSIDIWNEWVYNSIKIEETNK